MSAISGVFHRRGGDADPTCVESMLERMAGRSPDGRRIYCVGSVGLGHGALNTTPESLDEVQPMATSDDYLITGDLRLDNRRDLIGQLPIEEVADRLLGDGELVLSAYRKWGEQTPEFLEGAFAFAIWDPHARKLFCARDHLGAKPFTYFLSGDLFVFASDVEGVLAFAGVPRRVNELAIADFLSVELEGIDSTSSAFTDVFRLPPATSLVVSEDDHTQNQFWRPDPSAVLTLKSDEEYVEAFRSALRDAVGACLRSAAPPALMLSGGIDSGAIAAVAANELRNFGGPTLRTHSVARVDSDTDLESECIRAIVAQLGCESTIITIPQISELSGVTRRAGLHSCNIFDCLMTVPDLIYRSLRDEGTRVVLDGVDGDVVMALGRAHIAQLIQRGQRFRAFRESWATYRRRAPFSHPWRSILGMARSAVLPDLAQNLFRRVRSLGGGLDRAIQTGVINPDFANRINLEERIEHLDRLHWFDASGEARQDQVGSLTHPYVAAALERYDRVAARHGVEARHPLLSRRFVEFCLSLPWNLKMRDGWTKYILRRSMKGLVPEKGCWRTDKNDVLWAFTSAILEEEREFVTEVIESHREILSPYVDLARLQLILERRDAGITAFEEEGLWSAASLGLWLDRERLYH